MSEVINAGDVATVNASQLAPQSGPAQGSAAMAVMNSSLVPDKYSDDTFDDLAKIGDYLPYLKLCGSNTEEAKRGIIPIGNHALIRGKKVVDMGKTVQCWICAWRPMSLLTTGDKPVAFFNPNSDGFKKIREIAATGKFGDGALCGPQFLLFIPGQGFATYFMASKTAKNEAPNLKGLIDKCAIIGSKFIENKTYSWHGPTVVESSQQFETPEAQEYMETLNAFKNPPETDVQLVDKAPASGAEAAREL